MKYSFNQINSTTYEVVWVQDKNTRTITLTSPGDDTIINNLSNEENLNRFVDILIDNTLSNSNNNASSYTSAKNLYTTNREKFDQLKVEAQTAAFNSASFSEGILTLKSIGGDNTIISGIGGSSFPFTGSARITGSLEVTGSLRVSGSITGSLLGTASFALAVAGGGGGGGGIHALIKPQRGMGVSSALTTQWTLDGANDNEMIFYPFIPAQSFTSTNLSLWVNFGSDGATFRALIYSDLNGLPDTKLFESTTIDGSRSGLKTITNTFNFVAGTTYWLCYHSGVSGAALVSINANAAYCFAAKPLVGYTAFVNAYYLNFPLGSAPRTATIIQNQTRNQGLPNININV